MAENDMFTFVGEMLLDPGYTAIMTWQGIAKNKISPNVSVGDVVPIHNVRSFFHYSSFLSALLDFFFPRIESKSLKLECEKPEFRAI